jgi:hypothetical protein
MKYFDKIFFVVQQEVFLNDKIDIFKELNPLKNLEQSYECCRSI